MYLYHLKVMPMFSFTSLRAGILLLFIVLLGLNTVSGQRRSELMARIDTLELRLSEAEAAVRMARQNEKASLTKAESYEAQVDELKAANATLLTNLNSFAQVSNKNNNALNQALASLENKEAELRSIVETFGRNDSVIIALLTDAKRTLGPDARLKVASGSLVISGTLENLFGSDTGVEIAEGTDTWFKGIADLITAYPELGVTVEGLSMTGDISLAAQQATAVMNTFRETYNLDPDRMLSRGKDGNFSEGVNVLLHPNYRDFYQNVRAEVKR